MPNALTGDFDVVAQFAVPAVNRLLAGMHRNERFPHSITFRVDDSGNRRPGFPNPAVVGIVDSFGDSVANHQRIGRPDAFAGALASTSAVHSALDPVVNFHEGMLEEIPVEPSDLEGRAQVQLFPPTIEIADSSGARVTIKLGMIARYFPDPNTPPVAEFVRGELRITAPVSQVASQLANVITIDIKSVNLGVVFTPLWSSTPIGPGDLAAVNLLIRNAIRTSFLPSSSTLPSSIRHMQFKTMPQAVAVLLNMESAQGNRASANEVFLGGADDFAFGVGIDFIQSQFQPTIDRILSTPVDPISFSLWTPFGSYNITYRFALNSASVTLENGKIIFTVKGRATTGSAVAPNFNFTTRLSFSLDANDDTADLVPGDVSVDTSSWIIDRFRGRAETAVRHARDKALTDSGARETVRKMLSADRNLGTFIDSLLRRSGRRNRLFRPRVYHLAYNSVEIRNTGIILRGALNLPAWPAPHARFEQIPADGGGRFGAVAGGVARGPDHSAFKSWIPGGKIRSYEWKSLGSTGMGFVDENKFVLLDEGPGLSAADATPGRVTGFRPLCVTVHGSRLSAAGPVAEQQISATVCGVDRFPLPGTMLEGVDAPMIALARAAAGGGIQIDGHTLAQAAEPGRFAPNLVVHFGDGRSAEHLRVIARALDGSRRNDAPTAILAVLSREQLDAAPFIEGITYAENGTGQWERQYALRVTQRPTTVVISPKGEVVWKHEGDLDERSLTEALRMSLTRVARVKTTFKPPALSIGREPPDFAFAIARGSEMTLRKITEGPVALVFWRSSAPESVSLLKDLASRSNGRLRGDSMTIIAINDGEPAEAVRRFGQENRLEVTIVPDPARRISLAYGVNTWPTTVWVDELGAVAKVQLGTLGGESSASPFGQKSPDVSQNQAISERSSNR